MVAQRLAPSFCRLASEEVHGLDRAAMRLARYFRFRKGLAVELFTRRPAALRLKKHTVLSAWRCDLHIVSALGKTRRQVVHALSHRIAPEETYGLGRAAMRPVRLPASEKGLAVKPFTRRPEEAPHSPNQPVQT